MKKSKTPITPEVEKHEPLFQTSIFIDLLIIVLVAAAIYSNTFQSPMILDDEGSIQLHQPVHGLKNFFAEGWPGYNYLPNRAFGYLTFALNYEFGGLNVAGYHLVNLLIHIMTGLLVYAFTRMIFRTPLVREYSRLSEHAGVFAFVVALFFVCHPIQTQAVTYIVQRLTSMTTLFYLAAMICYLQWRVPSTAEEHLISPLRSSAWYLITLLMILLAMKTKEISFTLPVMFLVMEFSFFGLPDRKLFVKITPFLLTILLIPLTTYFKVAPIIKSTGGGGSFLSDVHTPALGIIRMTRWDYLFTQFSVIVTYFRLLFFPVNQHLDYDYPITRSLFELRPLLSLLLLLAIVALAIYMFVKSRKSAEQPVELAAPSMFDKPLLRIAAFGIIWFFLTISIESSIIVIQDVIYEHRLYLPSFGFFLTMTALGTLGIDRLEQRHSGLRKVVLAGVACIAVVFSIASYSRNSVWRNWITLWSDNVAKTPGKPRPHNILGIGYFYQGDSDNALKYYKEAARLKPDFIEAYYNMGLVYKAKKEHMESITMFMKALSLLAFDPVQYAKIYNEIGVNYAEFGNPDEAVKAFGYAVQYEPESVEFLNNYGFALSTIGKNNEAVMQYKKALQLEPGNSYAIKALQELQPR